MSTLDLAGAALLLKVHPKTLQQLARRGRVPACKVGRAWVFVERLLLDYLEAQALARVDDAPTRAAVVAERTVIEVLGGGCQSPIGALALPHDGGLELHASVTSFEGEELRAMAFGEIANPGALGRRVGEQLLADGAGELLDASNVAADSGE